jgi:hypothetical protein
MIPREIMVTECANRVQKVLLAGQVTLILVVV